MMIRCLTLLHVSLLFVTGIAQAEEPNASSASPAVLANPVKYQATELLAKGKHLVFIASDHEYRGEETLPAMARILAKTSWVRLYGLVRRGCERRDQGG